MYDIKFIVFRNCCLRQVDIAVFSEHDISDTRCAVGAIHNTIVEDPIQQHRWLLTRIINFCFYWYYVHFKCRKFCTEQCGPCLMYNAHAVLLESNRDTETCARADMYSNIRQHILQLAFEWNWMEYDQNEKLDSKQLKLFNWRITFGPCNNGMLCHRTKIDRAISTHTVAITYFSIDSVEKCFRLFVRFDDARWLQWST